MMDIIDLIPKCFKIKFFCAFLLLNSENAEKKPLEKSKG